MVVLVSPLFVECVTIGAVGEGRSFVVDGRLEYFEHGRLNALPFGLAQPVATAAGVNASQVQDFAGI